MWPCAPDEFLRYDVIHDHSTHFFFVAISSLIQVMDWLRLLASLRVLGMELVCI